MREILIEVFVFILVLSHVAAKEQESSDVKADFPRDQWRELSLMNVKRTFLMGATIQANVYAMGGLLEGSKSEASKIVERLNTTVANNTEWEILTGQNLLPIPIHSASATVFAGKIWIAGGFSDEWESLSTLYSYDPTVPIWSQLANMTIGRGGVCSVWAQGKLYVIGGRTFNTTYSDIVEIYDPITNSWFQGPSLKIGRSNAACASIYGKIYTIGGKSPYPLASVEYLDLSLTNPVWEQTNPLRIARSGCAAVTYENRILVFGGENARINSDVEDFNVETQEWRCRAPLPTARSNSVSVVVAQLAYVIGGTLDTSLNPSDRTEIYNPADNSDDGFCAPPESVGSLISLHHILLLYVSFLHVLCC